MFISYQRISSLDEFRYLLPYKELVGGALSISAQQFLAVNGFSNKFWGWGGEDDDMHGRLEQAGLLPVRLPAQRAVYTALPHTKQSPGPGPTDGGADPTVDGLSTLTYTLLTTELLPYCTILKVDLT